MVSFRLAIICVIMIIVPQYPFFTFINFWTNWFHISTSLLCNSLSGRFTCRKYTFSTLHARHCRVMIGLVKKSAVEKHTKNERMWRNDHVFRSGA